MLLKGEWCLSVLTYVADGAVCQRCTPIVGTVGHVWSLFRVAFELMPILLQTECNNFRSHLNDLKMDVMYHKRRQKRMAKFRPGHPAQPHPIGLTEPELRAAAGELLPKPCQRLVQAM